MTARACIVCDANRWAALYRGLVRCESCGFVRAAEFPSADALAALYGSDYFNGEEYADYLGDEAVHRVNFRRRFEQLTRVAGRIESMYEIGCAYGLWLRTAAEHGVRVAGIDIAADAVRHAAGTLGLNATLGEFEHARLTPGDYQCFCMWDTVEHLSDPETHIERVSRLLPSGGWLFLTTGDIGSATARRQGAAWRMIHPPTHLQYFSRESLARLLARHGLSAVHTESVAMCRSVHATLAGLERFGSGPLRSLARVAGAVLPEALTRRLRYSIDLGDIMLVCARKE